MSFRDLFRRKPVYHHPLLGDMKRCTETDWLAQSAHLSLSDLPMDVWLAGDASAPSTTASEALMRLLEDPSHLKALIQGHLFELWQNYFSESEPPDKLESAEAIWGTGTWISLDVTDEENLSATFTFSWQAEQDDHLVTVYIEDGAVAGSSIDG